MFNYYLTCRSLTYAQRIAKVLERSSIASKVSRTPGELSVNGCGYCVKIHESDLTNALKILKTAALNPSRVYAQYSNGIYFEV